MGEPGKQGREEVVAGEGAKGAVVQVVVEGEKGSQEMKGQEPLGTDAAQRDPNEIPARAQRDPIETHIPARRQLQSEPPLDPGETQIPARSLRDSS